jgi:luciferase family oxidoreductase group 1
MLPNHAPLVVAEQFRTLEALFPGRIDLGIGRAVAIQPDLLPALRRADDNYAAFSEQISELRGFLTGHFDASHRFQQAELPALSTVPPIYLLGASVSSASLAGRCGLPFAYAHYKNPAHTADALHLYRERFAGSETEPHAILTVRVIGRDTVAQASAAASWTAAVDIRQTATRQAGWTLDNRVLLDPSLSEIERKLTDALLAKSSTFVGDAKRLRSDLLALAADAGADEVMIVPTEFDTSGRLASLRTVTDGWLADLAQVHNSSSHPAAD